MIKSILYSGYAAYASDGNKMRMVLGRLPVVGKAASGMSEKAGIAWGVVGRILYELVKKLLFCAVFLLVPKILFAKYMSAGENGFGTEDCFVYFAIVLNGFCGSIMNSAIFKQSRNSYAALYDFKVNPGDFYRFALIRRGGLELITFWAAFSIFGMNPAKALYLSIVIFNARAVGETINIIYFKISRKTFSENGTANVILMLLSLFLAYYLPYVRGYVPGAYDLIFDTLWLAVILFAGAVFIYYVFTFGNYRKIAAACFGNLGGYETDDSKITSKITSDAVDEEIDNQLKNGYFDYERLNEAFFVENGRELIGIVAKRMFIAAVILIVCVVLVNSGQSSIMYRAMSFIMPIMTCVVYMFTSSDRVCRELYYQCDLRMLDYTEFRTKDAILSNFFIRLRYLILMDLLPCIILMTTVVIIGIGAKGEADVITTISTAIGVLFLSVLYTMANVFVYYFVQPYRKDYDKSNKVQIISTLIVCAVCAILVYCDISAIRYVVVIGVLLGVFAAASTTIVMQAGVRTYRNK